MPAPLKPKSPATTAVTKKKPSDKTKKSTTTAKIAAPTMTDLQLQISALQSKINSLTITNQSLQLEIQKQMTIQSRVLCDDQDGKADLIRTFIEMKTDLEEKVQLGFMKEQELMKEICKFLCCYEIVHKDNQISELNQKISDIQHRSK